MANPQKENGHIDIANEIAEALMRTNLSAYQSRILWAIWRKTYGWHKKEDWISNSQLVAMTGIAKGNVSRTIKELVKRKIVINSDNNLGFNKDYTQWRGLSIGERGYQFGSKVIPTDNKKLSESRDTKETIKETKQKKIIYTVEFENFWKEYPNHRSGKQAAYIRWIKCEPTKNYPKIMASIKEHKEESPEWDNGYIPLATTWLNQARWEAEFETDHGSDWLSETLRKAKKRRNGDAS